MIEVVEFKREHLDELLTIKRNQRLKKIFGPPNYEVLEKPRASYTGLCAETKRVVFTGGIVPFWNGRGEAWAFFGEDVKKYMVAIHKATLRFFQMQDYNRIEATVELNFRPGHRWMKSLGFRLEAPIMQKYWPDGSDNSLYARIK